MLPTPIFLGLPGGLAGKESTCNMGDLGSIPVGKGTATNSNILAWRTHGLYSGKESDITEGLSLSLVRTVTG